MVPTITGSGATRATSTADYDPVATGDEWAPTGTTATTSTPSDGPSITFETTHGHQVILSYHDMVMLALLAALAAAAAKGGMQ